MKKIITLTIALIIATITLSAKDNSKEVAYNKATNMKLTEVAGIYSLTGQGGVLIIGNEQTTREFFNNVNKVFAKEAVSKFFNIDEEKYEVKEDEEGHYIIKIGFGGVKIRPSDAFIFSTVMNAKEFKRSAGVVKDGIVQAGRTLISKD